MLSATVIAKVKVIGELRFCFIKDFHTISSMYIRVLGVSVLLLPAQNSWKSVNLIVDQSGKRHLHYSLLSSLAVH